METFIIIIGIILYSLIGTITWCIFMVNAKYNLESIHMFMFLLFWPIILLIVLYEYIIFSIKELYKLLKKNYTVMSSIPKIGKKYHFFDDGKLQNNRHYIAECVKILTPEEAKHYKLSEVNTLYEYRENAYKVFKEFYKSSTDYFIGCIIPNYFDSIVWFVRNPDNNWTILDIQDDWISGILDTDDELYKKGIDLFGEDYYT